MGIHRTRNGHGLGYMGLSGPQRLLGMKAQLTDFGTDIGAIVNLPIVCFWTRPIALLLFASRLDVGSTPH